MSILFVSFKTDTTCQNLTIEPLYICDVLQDEIVSKKRKGL